MKKQFVIINKGKGVLKITPSNLNEVEQPLTEIEALYDSQHLTQESKEVLMLRKNAYKKMQRVIDKYLETEWFDKNEEQKAKYRKENKKMI